jgi:hypothetical protein
VSFAAKEASVQAIKIADRVPDYHTGQGMTTEHNVQQMISGVLASTLRSVIMAQETARELREALHKAGYVIVPREPTKEMLDAAWADAISENALGVWTSMIETAESTTKSA